METKWKAAFFDLDGTLINSSRDIATAVNETLKVLGHSTISEKDIFSYIGNGIDKLMRRSLGKSIYDNPEYSFPEDYIWEQVEVLRGFYRKHMLDTTKPYPGIVETLENLKIRGLYLGVITNKPLFYSEEILDKLGLSGYFKLTYGGDSFPERKPHPRPLLEAIRSAGVLPRETLMIGDSPVDVIMGRTAGTYTCAVTWGIRSREELERENPNFIVEDTKEIVRILNHS